MAKVLINGQEEEIDDSVIELGKLARKVSIGKNRDTFLNLVAEEHPDIRIPEVENRKAIDAATKPLLDKIDSLQKERDEERAVNNLAARRKPLADLGLKDDDIKKVEQFMVDKKIGDHMLAYETMKAAERAAAPVPKVDYSRPALPTDDGNGLYKNPGQWRTNTLHRLIDESRAGKRI